ncbi:MAG TPA: sigma-70 family RNA polymerase sigma factor [Phycisphaerales bacterium]|nr:sigma-70 family RNA polymerase sigma factor [Phycisphaerales bacterium]HMP35981.1 sigma-70 family RNA polymerase sigma factor [Phycisphaerales bacterium]
MHDLPDAPRSPVSPDSGESPTPSPARPPADTIALLVGARSGDRAAQDGLLGAVYGELRALAGSFFRAQRAGHTLQPTVLVHEAWMRLFGAAPVEVRDRAHFMAVAATAMRQILIDHARGRNAAKRGGGAERVSIDAAVGSADGGGSSGLGSGAAGVLDILALDEALRRLESIDPRQARIVELRIFAGLSVAETAALVGVSHRTVEMDWAMARAWLSRELAR